MLEMSKMKTVLLEAVLMERGPLCLPGEDDAVRVIAHDFPAGKGNMGRKSLAEAVGG